MRKHPEPGTGHAHDRKRPPVGHPATVRHGSGDFEQEHPSRGVHSLPKMPSPVVPRAAERYRRKHRDQVPQVQHILHPEAGRALQRAPGASSKRGRMWLYLPDAPAMTGYRGSSLPDCRGSLSVQEREALNSAFTLHGPDTALSVMSSGTPTQRPLSWRGWQTRRWITRLSGLMLRHSTAARGAARWISLLPDIRASHSALQASAGARKTRDTSGRTSPASSGRCGRGSCSVKTSRGISAWDFPRSHESYREWVSQSGLACSRRQKRARPISGEGSSFWPTPTVGMSGNHTEHRVDVRGLRLIVDANLSGTQISMAEASRSWTLLWLTAKMLGFRAGAMPGYGFSLPLHVSIGIGSRYLPGTLSFNPAFSDWSMGWPIGWSNSCSPVTGFHRWLQRSRSELSRLERARADVA